jgi:outer membrane protein assembly factor BamB
MFRSVFIALVSALLTTAFCPNGSLWAARGELISETTAARYGLTRPWFTQVHHDRDLGKLQSLVLHDGTLYAQTNKGLIQAIDAETGQPLWERQVGKPIHPTMTPGTGRDFLAVVNGSRLYVLNRYNGDLLLERELSGSPGGGPALSDQWVYVPLRTGLIVAYRLAPPVDPAKESKGKQEETIEKRVLSESERREKIALNQDPIPPLICQSFGRVEVQPLVIRENAAEEYVVWPTDRGFLNFGRIDRLENKHLSLQFRLETGAAIVGRPAYLPPDPKTPGDSGLIFAASRDGFVYAVQESDSQLLWRFSVGEPVVESPAAIEDRVYVSAQLGGMHCLAAKTKQELWFVHDAAQFVAAGKGRVYVSDRMGRLLVLNAINGARLDVIPAESSTLKLLNTETDRIYLADKGGLIQCLHEVELAEPIRHNKERKQAAEASPTDKKESVEKEKPAKKESAAPKASAPKNTKKAKEGEEEEPPAAEQ